jgi:aromatic-L-amino-acid/L-tryptophan decarboxylase
MRLLSSERRSGGTDWDQTSGVIQDTASVSTLVALLCAREKAGNFGLSRGGLQERHEPLTVYASLQSHCSVEKAALLASFGREYLRLVPCDQNFAMRPEALEEAIRRDLARGMKPCAILATTGTTTSTRWIPLTRSRVWRSVMEPGCISTPRWRDRR